MPRTDAPPLTFHVHISTPFSSILTPPHPMRAIWHDMEGYYTVRYHSHSYHLLHTRTGAPYINLSAPIQPRPEPFPHNPFALPG